MRTRRAEPTRPRPSSATAAVDRGGGVEANCDRGGTAAVGQPHLRWPRKRAAGVWLITINGHVAPHDKLIGGPLIDWRYVSGLGLHLCPSRTRQEFCDFQCERCQTSGVRMNPAVRYEGQRQPRGVSRLRRATAMPCAGLRICVLAMEATTLPTALLLGALGEGERGAPAGWGVGGRGHGSSAAAGECLARQTPA